MLTSKWHKSTRSGAAGHCVEARLVGDTVEVRDTKAAGEGPSLSFNRDEWSAFLGGVEAGEFRI